MSAKREGPAQPCTDRTPARQTRSHRDNSVEVSLLFRSALCTAHPSSPPVNPSARLGTCWGLAYTQRWSQEERTHVVIMWLQGVRGCVAFINERLWYPFPPPPSKEDASVTRAAISFLRQHNARFELEQMRRRGSTRSGDRAHRLSAVTSWGVTQFDSLEDRRW